jgi:LAS superfamily LD-carboxypeptidase LdcB
MSRHNRQHTEDTLPIHIPVSQILHTLLRRFLLASILTICGALIIIHYIILLTRSTIETPLADMASTQNDAAYSKLLLSEQTRTNILALLANDYKLQVDQLNNVVQSYEHNVTSLSQTVEQYQKLAEIDPELLYKYSRVFFLNEHYVPSELSTIPQRYSYAGAHEFHAQSLPHLINLMNDAQHDKVPLLVSSAYRSFERQKHLKSYYLRTIGPASEQFSADQGLSEHQLGTTIDFTTREIGGPYDSFANTTQYSWLTKNAHKYGFTLSYPQYNIYFKYEPWHWRFVGIELATKLFNENKHFNDLDQREINTFLPSIFKQ